MASSWAVAAEGDRGPAGAGDETAVLVVVVVVVLHAHIMI
jgi:hypothetical protein